MEEMRLQSVNVGTIRELVPGDPDLRSAIDKRPIASAVIGAAGLAGDEVANTEYHGGPDQAVYAYGTADYAWWQEQLGRELVAGTFGENLTIDGLPTDLHVGDRLLIGSVILEATAPRIPCAKLCRRMDDPGFGLRFREAERPGTYFRVLNDGEVSRGDAVTMAEDCDSKVTIVDLFRLAFEAEPPEDVLSRALQAPISARARAKLEAKLARVTDDD